MNRTKRESPAVGRSDNVAPLESILRTEELRRRPPRAPDYATENRVLVALAQVLADSPQTILQTMAETMLEIFQCGSAGFSLLAEDETRFYWPAIAGAWQPHLGGGTPRDFGPCGDVLDYNAPLLFTHWERRYPYLLAAPPLAEEGLLIPFYIDDKAVGTIWTIAHDDRRRFDAEDLRLLESLGRFASAAYRAVGSQQDVRTQRRATLNLLEDAVESRQAMEKLNAELRASEERLAQELAATKQLQLASALLIEGGDINALYQKIVEAAAALMRSDMASLRALDEEQDALRLLAFRGFDPAFGQVFELNRPDTNTPCSVARRVGQRVIVADLETCDFLVGTATLADLRNAGIRAVQSTPLFSRGGRLLGVISTHWRTPHTPAQSDLRQFDILARQAADLLERKQAEAALRQSEASFHELAEQMPQMVWTHLPDGRIDWVNHRWLDYTGQTLEYVQTHPEAWAAALHPDDRERASARYRDGTRAGTGFTMEARFRRLADGEDRWQLNRSVPLRDAAGTIVKFLGTSTDIDDRKRAEEELLNADRHKNEFLAMLAHELRNPLAPISNAAHILALEKTENPVQRQARGIIERQTERLVRLVDDLLEISRITSGKIQLHQEHIAIGSIVERAVETVRPMIDQRRHTFTVSLPPEPIWLYADAARLEQVVVNLLTNAAKYTDDAGTIELIVQQEGTQAMLRVRDTGIGIAPELLPRVFDLFTQAERSLDRAQGGLGVGLSLVQRLVAMHGGTIKAESAVGQGSEFTVRLPISTATLAPSAVKLSDQPNTRPLRVLVVDDNIDTATTLAVLLGASGHLVWTAHHGHAALEIARENEPQAVFLDIGLPELDGYEIAKRLRQQPALRHTMLIALSGYGQADDQRRSREAGFNHHLVKPASFSEVERILATVSQGLSEPKPR